MENNYTQEEVKLLADMFFNRALGNESCTDFELYKSLVESDYNIMEALIYTKEKEEWYLSMEVYAEPGQGFYRTVPYRIRDNYDMLFITKIPFEDIPLYINNKCITEVLINWRLKIGK